jgi:hypothetical protein
MSILQEYNNNTNLLNSKIEETLMAVALLKETVVKLKQFERAAHFREMEKQLEQMKRDVFSFTV